MKLSCRPTKTWQTSWFKKNLCLMKQSNVTKKLSHKPTKVSKNSKSKLKSKRKKLLMVKRLLGKEKPESQTYRISLTKLRLKKKMKRLIKCKSESSMMRPLVNSMSWIILLMDFKIDLIKLLPKKNHWQISVVNK